jgi:hypothetical protein
MGVRALNRSLRLLGGLTPYGRPLSADRLHRLASKKTGLTDFGNPSYRVGFDKLLASLNEEARLTPLGRLIATEEVLTALTNRLQLEAHHQQHPEIGAEPIRSPIIMMGMGRSGTTILHELLALDPRNRIPATWEVDMPFPPPEKASYESDPRIDIIQKRLDRTDSIIPDFKSIHRMGARLPQECVRITTGEFASMIFGTTYEVPSYSNWMLEEADLAPAYEYHRRFLQLLQWKCPAERWVLTHRDPLKTASSLSSLISTLRAMGSDAVDPAAIAKQWMRWNTAGVNASARARQDGLIAPDQVIDVSFYEFMNAPLEQVRRIYDFFELELSPRVRTRMQDRLLRARAVATCSNTHAGLLEHPHRRPTRHPPV